MFASKWSPRGIAQRYRWYFESPADLALAVSVGIFLARLPSLLGKTDLRSFIASLRERRGQRASRDRINRMLSLWLRIPALRNRNTCYGRALTTYRFLETDGTLRVHLGIERRTNLQERLRGHAWVSLNGELIDPPEPVAQGRIREIPLPVHGAPEPA